VTIRKTAKTFLAASIFLELLRVFGDLDPEVAEKIKYAKFKAADIIRALKEGRTPTPGPPGGDASMIGEDFSPPAYDQPSSIPPVDQPSSLPPVDSLPSSSVSPSVSLPKSNLGAAPPHLPTVVPTRPTAPSYSGTSSPAEAETESRYDYKVLSQAQRHAKFAISSLQYDDIVSAMENLQKAMDLLRPYAS
jgi:vacuolar protein sorting-associated protein VTA1